MRRLHARGRPAAGDDGAQMLKIRFDVAGLPRGKGRHRSSPLMKGGAPVLNRRGRPVVIQHPDEKTVSYEAAIQHEATLAMRGRPPAKRGFLLVLSVRLPIPASWSQKKKDAARFGRVLATKKPDLDNVEKAVKDALNKVVWTDDCCVVDVVKNKRYSDRPGITVEVEELEGEPA